MADSASAVLDRSGVEAPLWQAWLDAKARLTAREGSGPFTIPGHHHRTDLVGDLVLDDLPLYGALASVKTATALVARAEALAAGLWNADWCRFSVAGSTHANQAVALAVARPGERVIVGRTLHRSLFLGLVMAGLEPVWLRPDVDPARGVPLGVTPAALEEAFAEAPDARAVFVGDPSYVGTLADLPALAEVAHRRGVPLVVDAAWAAYFGFHPALPDHPLNRGADAFVTSAHKTLPAWSQAALVIARTGLLDAGRLEAAFDAGHTTSPSGTMLASIDASRALLQARGSELLGPVITAVAALRDRLRDVPGLVVIEGADVDPLKVGVIFSGTGADGNAVEADLIARGMPVEMADRDTLLPIVTMADSPQDVAALAEEIAAAVERHRGVPRPVAGAAAWSVVQQWGCSPRDAFFAPRTRVPMAQALGRISAELVAPYPPGVPVLAPGDLVTEGALAALEVARISGVRIAYASDPTLATLDVVAGARESVQPTAATSR